MPAQSVSIIFLHNWKQCIDGIKIYYKGMLEKVMMQRTQYFSPFFVIEKQHMHSN